MIAAGQVISHDVMARFSKLLESKRLAHAYLFAGPKRTGKNETALAVAKLVNCERRTKEGFCDICDSCVKIGRLQHPDVHIVAPMEALIKIDDIREMLTQSQLRSFEAKIKVFIIADVDRLTLEAGNALLKTLEEPAKDTLILLTTSVLDRVLDTVKSRCQICFFFPLSREALKQRFLADRQFNDLETHFLAFFSEGCPGRIAEGKAKDVLKRRDEAVDQFIFSDNDEAFVKKVLADDQKAVEMIQFVFCWFRDVMLLQLNITKAHLVNADRLSDLERSSRNYSFEELGRILDDVVVARKALDENFNVKIPLALLKEKIWKK